MKSLTLMNMNNCGCEVKYLLILLIINPIAYVLHHYIQF